MNNNPNCPCGEAVHKKKGEISGTCAAAPFDAASPSMSHGLGKGIVGMVVIHQFWKFVVAMRILFGYLSVSEYTVDEGGRKA